MQGREDRAGGRSKARRKVLNGEENMTQSMNQSHQKATKGTGDMASLVKCLPHKHENPTLAP